MSAGRSAAASHFFILRSVSRGERRLPFPFWNTGHPPSPPSGMNASVALRKRRNASNALEPRMQRRCFEPFPVTITVPLAKSTSPHASASISAMRHPVEYNDSYSAASRMHAKISAIRDGEFSFRLSASISLSGADRNLFASSTESTFGNDLASLGPRSAENGFPDTAPSRESQR